MCSMESPEMSGNRFPDPEDYPKGGSFAALLDWHLKNGTRPERDVETLTRSWTNKDFGSAVSGRSAEEDVCRKNSENWRSGSVRPSDLASIERVLFGKNKTYDRWRRELRTAYDAIAKGKERKRTENRPASEALSAAISRVKSETATSKDRTLLQQAVYDGQLAVIFPDEMTRSVEASGIVIVSDERGGDESGDSELAAKVLDFVSPARAGRLPPRSQLLMIGRSRAMTEIRNRLTGVGAPRRLDRTVVRGLPGVGKSTLANAVAHDWELGRAFSDGVLWASLTQNPDTMSQLGAWGNGMGIPGLGSQPTVQEAVDRIKRHLAERRVLLIVDDVWEPAHAAPFIQTRGPNCGLLLTSRLPWVASELSVDGDAYVLPVLEEPDALTLLRLLAPAVVAGKTDACRELVRDLQCLPLGIHVAGRLLKEEARLGWSVDALLIRLRDATDIITSRAPLEFADIETLSIPTVEALLKLSTDLLDTEYLKYFAFLGAFKPRPATFDLRILQEIWDVADPKPVVRKFASLGLIELVNGRFEMHALLVAHARSLSN